MGSINLDTSHYSKREGSAATICAALALTLSTLKNYEDVSIDVFSDESSQPVALGTIPEIEITVGDVLRDTTASLQTGKQKTKSAIAILLNGVRIDLNNCEYKLVVTFEEIQSKITISAPRAASSSGTWEVKCLRDRLSHIYDQLRRSDPDTKINTLNLVSAADLEQISQWTAQPLPYVSDCLHTLFVDQARLTPGREAVYAWDTRLTYGELDSYSRRLAHHLVSLGVRPHDVVPFCYEKSGYAVVVLLAILRAGAICCPIDPAASSQRTTQIVEQTHARFGVASRKTAEALTPFLSRVVVSVDHAFLEQLPEAPPDETALVKPNDLAYLMFTSGSTGQPKGIALQHDNIVTSNHSTSKAWDFSSDTRIYQFSAFTFDAHISDIFAPLALGGAVCIPSEEDRLSNLNRSVRESGATFVFMTPTVVSLMNPQEVPNLKAIITGGELVPRSLVELWAEHLDFRVVYGMTEASIYSSSSTRLSHHSLSTNIGYAYGCRFWITEPEDPLSLAPLGRIGELLIEGNTLARGYFNDDINTKKSFVQIPVGQKQGLEQVRNVLRTGDLAHYTSDGTINIIGRKDTMVKFRGRRVELGDVENAILKVAPDVESVAVDIVSGSTDESAIAAFVDFTDNAGMAIPSSTSFLLEPDNCTTCRFRSIEQSLRTVFEAYMLPSLYVPLRSMPHTVSGKKDRRALKQMINDLTIMQKRRYMLSLSTSSEEPQSEVEFTLRDLWADVLKLSVENIGRRDDFFILGGNSLSAMRLASSAKGKSLGLNVSDVHSAPILAHLAELVVNNSRSNQVSTTKIAPFSLVSGLRDTFNSKLMMTIAAQCGVAESEIEDVWPCTALQEALVTLTMKRPGTYMAQYVFHTPDSVDLSRLRKAWETLVDSAQTLRTRIFTSPLSDPLNVVLTAGIVWQCFDDLDEYLRLDREQLMAFGTALTRFAYCPTTGTEGGSVVVTLHHALYDGWSLQLLFESLASLYNGGRCSRLASMNGFINHIQQGNQKEGFAFWAKQMAACNSVPFPAQTVQSQQASRVESVARLSISHRHPAGLNSISSSAIVRAAWAITLSRHCGSQDIVFGATLSGRNTAFPDISAVAGPTICTVPVRIQVLEQQRIRDLLTQVQSDATAMMPFEHTGLQKIRSINADTQRAASFQNLLVIQPQTMAALTQLLQEKGIEMALPGGDGDFHDYPLVLECAMRDESIAATARFDATIISPAMMDVILHHFEAAIQYIASNLDDMTSDIDLFGAYDEALITEWNKNSVVEVSECIHDLVERQVRKRPQAIAVEAWDGSLTYRELGRLSDLLAAHLVENYGIGPECLVPFCFEKSVWATVAQLGILKAGAACVGLNADQPQNRLSEIVQQANAILILTSAKHVSMGRDLCAHSVAVSSDLFTTIERDAPVATTAARATHRNVAFVTFTSGSTGRPKGIVTEHRAMSTSIFEHGRVIGITEQSRALQFASYSFDISIGDTFSTLVHGGCVCVPSDEERLQNLAGAINKYQANLAHLTSTVASLMTPSAVPCLRTMTLSGEAVKQEIVRTWAPELHLIILYGPAEASIWCTANPKTVSTTHCSNIGFNMGARNWIMDSSDHRRFCPVGCVGEILVDGPIVAREYLHNEEQTSASFVRDAARLDGDPRVMYKSGDLARYNLDGSLHFVSRADTQVKLRGQRIELAEIEFALRNHLPTVQNVVADMASLDRRKDAIQGREQCIVAFYVTLSTDDAATTEAHIILPTLEQQNQIRQAHEQILNALPVYMVPSYYLPLTKLPTLPASGKTDRRTLRALVEAIGSDEFALYTVDRCVGQDPTTEMERLLQKLWHDSLGFTTQTAYREDNYFHLGGDSVSAIRMSMRAQQEGLQLSVANMLRFPRLREMAEHLYTDNVGFTNKVKTTQMQEPRREQIETAARVCGVAEDKVQHMYPCSALQEGLFALSMQYAGTYMAQTVLTIPSSVDKKKFTSAVKQTLAHHTTLRTRVVDIPGTSGLTQVVVATEIACEYPDNLDRYLEAERQNSVEFGAPLCRIAIFDNKLVISAHHVLYDGWSWEIIYDDIVHSYTGSNVDVKNRATFRHYIDYIGSVPTHGVLEFWAQKLQHTNTATLPPHPGKAYVPQVDSDITRNLELCFNTGLASTLPVLVQAAWALTNAVYTSSDSVTFGMLLSGRNVPVAGIGDITGPTVAAVPYQVAIDLTSSVKDLLDDVQGWNIEVVGKEHIGLQQIRRINPETALASDFQSQLVIQPKSDRRTALQRIGIDLQQASQKGFGTFPLTLECEITHTGICTTARFDEQLIPSQQMERIINFFHIVLSRMNSSPAEALLHELVHIDSADLETIYAWQAKGSIGAVTDCIHHAVRRQVNLQPGNPAITAWDGALSYGELEVMSTALSHHFQSHGIKPADIVLLVFDKSLWAVVCMLAVLKAGAVCASVDGAIPDLRLCAIQEASAAQFVLTDATHEARFKSMKLQTLVIDEALIRALPPQDGDACSEITPAHLAFLVFTSGSTGTPKGVMLEHASVCTASKEHAELANIGPGTRYLQFSAYAYDVHITDIFTALMYGACVAIPSEHERLNDLAGSINRLQANHAYFTPTAASLIKPEEVPSLKSMVVGGESLTMELVRRWTPHVRLWNAYGPSETSNWACAVEMFAHSVRPSVISSTARSSAWVVDSSNHNVLIPIGCVGELIVGGPTLARGYLNDPDRTSAAFLQQPDWYHGNAQQRFYQTGDLVRYEADGSLVYIGRKDTQVKVHGQRLELAEVESIIVEAPEVCSAIVTMPKQGLCKNRLVAVVSLTNTKLSPEVCDSMNLLEGLQLEHTRPTLSSIQDHLARKLATWMVPNMWLFVNQIPHSLTGKVNRRAVEELVIGLDKDIFSDLVQKASEEEEVQPRNELESKVQAIWADVLNLTPTTIGVHHSFTSLGGDSVSAIQAVSRCRAQGLGITVRDILLSGSIAALCPKISPLTPTKQVAKSVPISGDRFPLLSLTTSTRMLLESALLKLPSVSSLREVEDVYPSSPLQQGILISQARNSDLYKVENYFQISASEIGGTVDPYAVVSAWMAVVRRHAILRTVFIPSMDQTNSFWQVVLHQIDAATMIDINQISDGGKALTKLRGWEPVSFVNDIVPHRLIVTAIDQGSTVYCRLDISHALVDAHATKILLRELIYAYDEALHHLPVAPKYSSYISHLLNMSDTDDMTFWTEYLAGSQPCHFPALNDGNDDLTESFREEITFSGMHELLQCCRNLNITFANMVQLVWALVLQTYTNEDDVLFGCLVSGRDLPVPDAEITLGPFVNMLVCRALVSHDQSLVQTLENMRDQFLHSLDHQTTPLSAVQHALGFGGSPLFNTSMSLHKIGSSRREELVGREVLISRLHDEDPTEFDANLVLAYSETDLQGEIVFNAKNISKEFGFLIVDTFEQILTSMLNIAPGQTIGDISRLGPSNKERISQVIAPPATKIEQCVHHAFEAQVRRAPDAVAITSWDGDLTYGELNKLSNRLAHVLVDIGVKSEDIVPLCFEKGLWVVVAQLAVLKAGAAVLTLDTSHPADRLHVMVETSKASVVIGHPDRVHRMNKETLASRQLILINDELVQKLAPSALPPNIAVKPSNLAFIVFTSGSTGLPKGIMLEHRAVRTASQRHADMFKVKPGARCFQFSAFAFDVHISDIFVPLQYGATVCMPSESERMDDLPGAIKRSDASIAYLTPTVGSLFGPEDVPCLKYVLMGGEPLSKQIAKKWSGNVFVVNALAPSETSNWVSYKRIDPETTQPLNVGRGVGLSAWLVEPSGGHELVPLGAVGEVCVESPSLARGYLHDPAKTAASFLVDPSFLLPNDNQGRRIYCLGDLVRANSDGSMVYVGRKDNQIKIHGQRLESAEVEVVLAESAEVRHVLVSRPKEGACANQTVAIMALERVQSLAGPPLTLLTDEDRAYAQEALGHITDLANQKLAAWMMPTVWILVNRIPSSASGKLDRNTVKNWLIHMSTELRTTISTFTTDVQGLEPRNETETKLQRVWSKVLNIPLERTFIDSSFIRLGGDSITAMQIISRCRLDEQLAVTVKDVLMCKTIAELALRARLVVSEPVVSAAEEKDDDCGTGQFELSPIQKMFYNTTSNPERHYNQSFLLRLQKKITASDLSAAATLLVDHHAMLRGRLISAPSGQWEQEVTEHDFSKPVQVQQHSISSIDDIEPILEQAQTQFTLTSGSLYGFHLIAVGQVEQLLFITIHHLNVDLVSWRIILHDLEQILTNGHMTGIKTLSFRRWTEEQSKIACTLKVSEAFPFVIPPVALDFWNMQLNPNRSGDAVTHSFRLAAEPTTCLLRSTVQSLHAEPLDILIAALVASFRQAFPHRTVPAIFNESHGREPWDDTIDVSRTVGWFTTMYPVYSNDIVDRITELGAGHCNNVGYRTKIGAVVKSVSRTRAMVPRNGWDYFNLRYSSSTAATEAFAGHDDIEVVFNYAGIYQQLERSESLFARVPPHLIDMHMTNPDMPQQGVFSIGAGVEAGELYFDFTFNQDIAHQEQIHSWIDGCKGLLEEMARSM